MKHIIRKAYWNNEKEEKWLNEMASKGLSLHSYFWCKYVFEETPPGEYIYRIEYLEHRANHPEIQNYFRFMEEVGVECIATYMQWAYFRKKAVDGEFDLYSDIDSKIRHYRRICAFWTALASFQLFAGIYNLLLPFILHHTDSYNVWLNFHLGIALCIFAAVFIGTLVIPKAIKIRNLKKKRKIQE